MKKDVIYINRASLDISIDEFDAIEDTHKFSHEYKKKKKKNMREYKKRLLPSRYINIKTAVAICLMILISSPIISYAAANSSFFDNDFFGRIWGNLTRQDVKSHDEVIYDELGMPINYTFPERDYVDINDEAAEKLTNNNILHTSIVKKLGDTTLTILSTVYDGNAAIMEFKLQREGGVNAFEYSSQDNEYQGAQFTHEPTFWFHFPECSENIIVDLERSTDDVLYCYDYMTLDPALYDKKQESLDLEVCEYPCTRGELFEADEKTFNRYQKNTKTSNIKVPLGSPVKTTDYKNADGGILSISPLAMKIDMDTGLNLSNNGEYDHEKIYNVDINYKAEKNYKVLEHSLKGIHSCETKIDNTNAISCNREGYTVILFNRLVDTDKIDTITVNNTTYKLP